MFAAIKRNTFINKHVKFINKIYIGSVAVLLVIVPVFATLISQPLASASSPTSPTQAQFADPNPSSTDYFGYSVSTSADGLTAVVGAPLTADSNSNASAGAAYVFYFINGSWQEVAQLTPSDGGANNLFGYSVSMDSTGNNIVVGSYQECVTSGCINATGKAYVYSAPAGGWYNNWSANGSPAAPLTPALMIPQNVELIGSDSVNLSYFGSAVAFSADASTIVVGASNQNSGEAYVYNAPSGGWSAASGTLNENARLINSDTSVNNSLGSSVAVSNNGSVIVIGAPGPSTATGAAYVYNENFEAGQSSGWSQQPTDPALTETNKISNSVDGIAGDSFGWSVALTPDGNHLVIGAPFQSQGGINNSGAAYLYNYVSGSNTWSLNNNGEMLEPQISDPNNANDNSGWSVDISNDASVILVGSPHHVVGANMNEGTTFIWNNDLTGGNLTFSQNLSPSPTVSTDAGLNFGYSVFLVNNDAGAVIGAPDFSGGQVASAPLTTSNKTMSHFLSTNSLTSTSNTSTSGGKAYSFNLNPKPSLLPTITSLSSSNTGIGDQVTITGTNLSGSSVKFNNVGATIVGSPSTTSLTVIVPTGATSGSLNLTTINGNVSVAFNVNSSAPSVTSFTPSSASPGSLVTITGTRLASASVTLNGSPITLSSDSKTTIKFKVPLSATSGYILISNLGGTGGTQTILTVLTPSGLTLSKSTSAIGTKVTIHGTNLAGINKVLFQGNPVTIVSRTNTALSITVPNYSSGTSGAFVLSNTLANPLATYNTPIFTVK